MRRLVFALAMISVLASSGCTTIPWMTGGSATGQGVEITDFQADIQNVYSGETVNFEAKVQNLGSFDSDGQVNLHLGEWVCNPGVMQPVRFDSLVAPDEERGTAGEEFVARWSCKAPDIEKGLEIPFEARAEVWYDYRTITSKSITLLPTADLVALRDAGQTLPSEIISESNSPVSVSINVEGPIRVNRDTSSIEFPVNIVVDNTGGGVVEATKVDLDVEVFGGLTAISDDNCDYQGMMLWRGRSQSITCELRANNVQVITQARIVATATYGYTKSATTNVNVQGATAAFK